MLSRLSTRWNEVRRIRRLRAFELYGARRAEDDRACAVIVPAAHADRAASMRALDELARVHRLLSHSLIARVSGAGLVDGDVPFVEFDVGVVADGEELMNLMAVAKEKLPYEASDGALLVTRKAFEAVHETTDPTTGSRVVLGRICPANLLFDAQGGWQVFGFGHNVACLDEHGEVDRGVRSFAAPPEVVARESDTADMMALFAMAREFVPHTNLPSLIADALRGTPPAGVAEVLWLFVRRVNTPLPSTREEVRASMEVAERIRQATRKSANPGAFSAYVARLFSSSGIFTRAEVEPSRAVGISSDATWLEDAGKRIKFTGPQRRLLLALVTAHVQDPARPLNVWELFEAGWPGERAPYEVCVNRVYVTLARLRTRLPNGTVERFDEGWRLSPSVRVRVES